eukprot:8163488-Alexandrium_andersonii.AAC.1
MVTHEHLSNTAAKFEKVGARQELVDLQKDFAQGKKVAKACLGQLKKCALNLSKAVDAEIERSTKQASAAVAASAGG